MLILVVLILATGGWSAPRLHILNTTVTCHVFFLVRFNVCIHFKHKVHICVSAGVGSLYCQELFLTKKKKCVQNIFEPYNEGNIAY